MKGKKLGIKWKLFAYLLGFCLLLLLILTLFQTVLLDRFYVSIKQRQVEKEVLSISGYVEETDWESLEEITRYSGDLFVEVWSMELGLVASSGSFQDGIHMQLRANEIKGLFQRLEAAGGAVTQWYESKGGPRVQESVVSARMVEANDENRYAVVVSAGLTPVNATVDTLRIQLLYISAIMIVLSVLLALLISKKVSRPLVSISQTAGELGRGNYDVVFEGVGYQEVVQLAEVLNEAAGELSRTEALRKELIANVSHDLRTPLTLIAGYSEMIRDMPGEATAENMQVIIDETKRLSSLVTDLLDLSKLQAGVGNLSMGSFDLCELTEEITGRVSRFYEKDGYRIVFESSGPVMVTGDRERISQVIYNFLQNAVTHTGPDLRILLRLTAEEDSARLEVTDTGAGIAPEDLPYIWDRYYKVEKEHRRAAMGSGLGLSIVRSILDHHPGVRYGVTSVPGKGSTFWFSIPLASEKKLR